ncbi:MAG: hypothetical protein WEB52_04180 [Dehalococcoidia bacterium]
MSRLFDITINRRKLLTSAAVVGAGALALANTQCDPALVRRVHQIEGRRDPRHAVWVWQFSEDGTADEIAATLAANNLAAIVKTHDGVEWMANFDHVPGAIDGPAQVGTIAGIFESYGVPFHAWCVVKGVDPVREAEMAAAVLANGARSLTLDLEDHPGFWEGTRVSAAIFGAELRARNAFARVDVSVDPRPWLNLRLPIDEFVHVTDGIRPQLYWDLFQGVDQRNAWAYMGYPAVEGVTPEFLVDASIRMFAAHDRWLLPIAHASPGDGASFARFAHRAWQHQMPELSVWRYAIADTALLDYLRRNPPGAEPSGV